MTSEQRSKWELTESRKRNLAGAILESFINADSLISDAELLMSNARAHRAASLAILGIEELGKSYFLKCIYDGVGEFKWNEDAEKKLINHKFKQEFAFDTFNVNTRVFNTVFSADNRLDEMNFLLEETKKLLRSKGVMDIEKQNMQFVTINQDCSYKIPSTIPFDRCDYIIMTAKLICSLMRSLIPGNPDFAMSIKPYKLKLSKPLESLQPSNDDLNAIVTNIVFKLRA